MKALTVKQPWASLIVEGIKDIENRTWKCPKKYIGQRVLIHASMGLPMYMSGYYNRYLTIEQNDVAKKKMGVDYFHLELQTSAIIGSVEIVDCVINHQSIWAEKTDVINGGPYDIFPIYGVKIYNWVLANPIMFHEPILCKGKLSFWDYQNILAEPEEEGGPLFCNCQLPVKLENQVMPMGDGSYRCRYCGGIWYR